MPTFSLVPTDAFVRQLKRLSKRYRSLVDDMQELGEALETHPVQGEALGKDCYKIRLKITSKGKGKSGSGRVITCVKIVAETVYLLALYDKSERENLADVELDALLKKAGLR